MLARMECSRSIRRGGQLDFLGSIIQHPPEDDLSGGPGGITFQTLLYGGWFLSVTAITAA
jgi:hypothetical protein